MLAENIATFIARAAERAAPHAFRQGARKPPLALPRGPSLDLLATTRVRKVSALALEGLAHLARGFPAFVSHEVLTAADVLVLQSRGRRCVTLLPADSAAPTPHSSALEFLLHDLCHLAKFANPLHYEEQVGFFTVLARVFDSSPWRAAESRLDPQWQRDRDDISSDMNGSSIFLLAVLKMKLKMAARRLQGDPVNHGPLRPAEAAAYHTLLDALLTSMSLPSRVREAAVAISTRRDSPEAASTIAAYFRAAGHDARRSGIAH